MDLTVRVTQVAVHAAHSNRTANATAFRGYLRRR